MRKILLVVSITFFLVSLSSIALSEIKPGQKFTKENWETVKDLLPEPVAEWLKEGHIAIETDKVEYPFELPKNFRLASAENAGKYSVDKDGNLIVKATGKLPDFVYGMPFPEVDASDPQAGVKIMWNFYFQQFQLSSQEYAYDITWVSYKKFERNFGGLWTRLFYTGRHDGPIPNPDNVDFKDIISVTYPYDVAGFATMLWRNKSAGGLDKDQLWAYAPALRRVRQLSPANSSDAFLGSDIANDDALGFRAKIQTFEWKLLGEKEILGPFAATKPTVLKWDERRKAWATDENTPVAKYGYDYKDWKGAAWAPVDIVWDIRPVYIIEGIPKDPYYNYGRQVFYIDQEALCIYNKVIHDRAGSYWKNMLMGFGWVYAPGKEDELSTWIILFHCIVDSKSKHATVTHSWVTDPPTIFASQKFKDRNFSLKSLLEAGK